MANSNLIFSFEDLSSKDKVAQKIVRYFKRGGLEVVQVDDPQKMKRTSGVTYKELNVVLANGESIMFRIKQTGDIFQVLINGKVVPIKNQDNQKDAIDEIIALSKTRSSAYQKRLAKQRVKEIDSGSKAKEKKVAITQKMKEQNLISKRDQLKADIKDAEDILLELRGATSKK